MSLTNSYTGGFRCCSTQKTVCTLPCKEMQVQTQRLAGHGQWSWQQPFGAWGLSCNLKQIRLRKHKTKCRAWEVPIKNLNRMWEFGAIWEASFSPARLWCWKCHLSGYRSQNMSWLALMLQCTKCRDANILQSTVYWRFPNRFGGSQQRSIH